MIKYHQTKAPFVEQKGCELHLGTMWYDHTIVKVAQHWRVESGLDRKGKNISEDKWLKNILYKNVHNIYNRNRSMERGLKMKTSGSFWSLFQ